MNEIKINQFLNEQLHIKQLSSGIKCYIIPKNDYIEKQAAVAVGYGSADIEFSTSSKKMRYPFGIAHFLEHKLFEDEKINVFEQFTKNGAEVNAFTNFTNTAYYFNCIDNFEDNLRLLLSFVQTPYFTEKNVNKEKGIIIQEINMYKDDPFWRGYVNLLEAMYHVCPIRYDIAGSEDSVNEITPDMLYECYKLFYTPENMAVICIGSFEIDKIYDIIEKSMQGISSGFKIERNYGNEPDNVSQKEKEITMQTVIPMFNIGFKDIDNDTDILKRLAAGKMLIDMVAGEGSKLYESLYTSNLIDESYSLEYTGGTYFGYSLITGFSENPKKVNEMLLKECSNLLSNGLSEESFQRIKKKHLGKLCKTFNSIYSITQAQIDFFSKSRNLFDLLDTYNNLTISDVENKLKSHLIDKMNSLSIVY